MQSLMLPVDYQNEQVVRLQIVFDLKPEMDRSQFRCHRVTLNETE